MAHASGLPGPISWQPSEGWDGDNGDWSTFFLRVGSPEQTVRVLPSTAGQATWVVMDGGCQPFSSECSNERGDTVNLNQSSSRKEIGLFDLGLELNFGRNESGDYGLDSLALGLSNTTGGPALDSQVVVGIETNHYRVGMFGLNEQPTNLSSYTNSYPSFLTSLKTQNLIPSLSWGYTAGACYRSKGVFGSLTLGGFDQSRFTPNNISFDLTADVQRDLVVGLQSITAKYKNGSTQALLPSPALMFIDSTIPYIYLPSTACQVFERELGLVWNSSENVYFVDENLHQTLINTNPNFTFTIGNDEQSQPTMDIVLPYSSFDLTFKPPIFPNDTSYFPIRRATNESQYTLGRAFLQEAYIITNYEHRNFSVAQSKFVDGLQSDIVAIKTNSTSPDLRRQGIDRNSIIGAAVGSSVAALLLLLILFLIRKRLRLSKSRLAAALSSPKSSQKSTHSDISVLEEIGNNSLYNAYPELHDTERVEMLTLPIPPDPRNSISELPSSSISAMSSSDIGPKVPKKAVDLIQAIVVRGQKPRSKSLDDPNSSSNWHSQHKVTKAHRRPVLSLITSNPSVPPRKESSVIHRDTIHPRPPTGNGIEVSPSEPSGHHELPVSLHSRLEPNRTDSVSSTYANIIDYDYYKHGTPVDDGNVPDS